MFFVWFVFSCVVGYFSLHATQQWIDAGNELKKPTHDYRIMKKRQHDFNQAAIWFGAVLLVFIFSTHMLFNAR